MMRNFSRRSVIALTGGAVAVAGAMAPAQASSATTSWRTDALVGARGSETVLSTIHAVRANDAWAAGASASANGNQLVALVEHWTGKSWTAAALPSKVKTAWDKTGPVLDVIGASSSSNVWVFNAFGGNGGSDTYLRLAGRTWTTGTLPGTSVARGHFVLINSVEVLGKAGVWVFGGQLSVSAASEAFKPYAAHYNGQRWRTVTVPGSGEVTAESVITPSDIWAAIGVNSLGSSISKASKPAVVHWNGKRWQRASSEPVLPAGADLTAVTATAGNHVWVGGDVPTKAGGTASDFVAAYNGHAWAAPVTLRRSAATAAVSGRQPYEIESLVQDGAGGLWALAGNLAPASPRLWHYAGGKWALPVSPGFGNPRRALIQLSAVPGARGSVWGAGTSGKQASAKGLIAITGAIPR